MPLLQFPHTIFEVRLNKAIINLDYNIDWNVMCYSLDFTNGGSNFLQTLPTLWLANVDTNGFSWCYLTLRIQNISNPTSRFTIKCWKALANDFPFSVIFLFFIISIYTIPDLSKNGWLPKDTFNNLEKISQLRVLPLMLLGFNTLTQQPTSPFHGGIFLKVLQKHVDGWMVSIDTRPWVSA